jgi:hypothetical protein
MFKIPILILTYNRPKKFLKVLRSLKLVKPRKIYISCDGPKNIEDLIKIKNIRKNISKITWKCKVYENFFQKNLGVKHSPEKSIDWFFKKEKFGIILEDDCVPSKTFYKFCETLLNKYKNNNNIWAISGYNFKGKTDFGDGDYFISKYFLGWGWASWRRAWLKNDKELKFWKRWRKEKLLNMFFSKNIEIKYWTKMIDKFYDKKIVSWDMFFLASMWKNKSFCILPNINMIKNIGFDSEATYGINNKYSTPNVKNFLRNVKHPINLRIYPKAESQLFNEFFKGKNFLYPWRFFYIIKLLFVNPTFFLNKIKIFLKIKYFKTVK